MVLSTVRVEDFDRFWATFSTKGAEKRKQHGSTGSRVFRDPSDDGRVWVVFDMEDADYLALLNDPEMPAIFQEAGLEGRPEHAELVKEHEV
jgi:hypothetical protein